MFVKNKVYEISDDGLQTNNYREEDKTSDEKLAIIQKALKSFIIKCEISKSGATITRKYSLILDEKRKDGFNSNIIDSIFKSKENEFCKTIINYLPAMLYITDLPDFYSENNFATTGDAKHEECKNLIDNLFISGTSRSFQFFNLYSSDKAEYNATKSQVEQFLKKEFTNRWNQFGLNASFGELDLTIDAFPDSKTINIFVQEKGTIGNNSYPIDERSMGFKWFFKFVMNISFNPLK